MTEEQFFIQILNDHLHEHETIPRPQTNWSAVLSLAKIHEVGGIVYYQCREFLPEPYRTAFEKMYSMALFYSVNRQKAMNRAAQAMQGLSFCSVKGMEVAQFYPLPSLRTMGDCDIAIDPKSFKKATEALRAAGFEGTGSIEDHEWICQYKNMHFELHDMLVKPEEYASKDQAAFFNDFTSHMSNGKLNWDFHFLFLLMHLRKHFMGNGVGIRQFADIAVVMKNNVGMDWNWITDKLDELKLKRFAHSCFGLIEDWFGVKAPVKYDRLDEETVAAVMDKVMNNGVFGFADEENRDNKAKNAILLGDGSVPSNRIKYLFLNLFPKYTYMRRYPGCDFLAGRHWLLPIAWIRRFWVIFKSKNNDSRMNTFKGTFVSNMELEKRRELMEKMGLI